MKAKEFEGPKVIVRHDTTFTQALSSAIAVINSTLDLDQVLERILECIAQVLPPHDLSHIMLVEGDTAQIVRGTGYTGLGTRAAKLNLKLPLHTVPTLRKIIATEQPLIIENTRASNDWIDFPDFPETSWIRSFVGVPIRTDGQLIGLLNSASAALKCFHAVDAEHLQIFADQVGIAIRNARLYEKVRGQAIELADHVASRTAALEHEQKHLQAILDSTGEGIFYTETGCIEYANRRLCSMTGYSVEDLIGQPISFLHNDLLTNPSLSKLYDVKRATPESGGVWHGEAYLRRRNASIFIAGMTISLIGVPGAGSIRTVTIVRDISQEKTLEEQKDRFIANASHELRTPITNLKLLWHLLLKQPQAQERHLGVMGKTLDHMVSLAEELLDISRFEQGVIVLQRKDVLLQSLIGDVIQMQQAYADQKDIEIIAVLWDVPLSMYVDPVRITQVLTNLIVNATNYTLQGGQITVRMYVQQESNPRSVLIEVTDNGLGIPSDLLPKIFDPFVRVHESISRGTGLGLTISREIMRLHDGDLTVQSEVNVGSTFTMSLPLAD